MDIVDNFIPSFYQKAIHDSIVFEQTPWTIIDGVSGSNPNVSVPGVSILKTQTGFYHVCFGDNQVYSNLFYTIRPMIDAISHFQKTPVKTLLRIKVGMFIKSGEIGSNSPHVDFSDEHKTMLYYVNDSDGDTIFYNENYKTIKNSKSFSVDQKVNPVMGRAVLFDGLKFHSSSPPFLNDRRVVININYL
jgi:hypothetical protein